MANQAVSKLANQSQAESTPPWMRDAARADKALAASTPKQSSRILALDGLRAIAILAIVAYHLQVSWLPSGHMGVVMFLVLTGYLVTNSLQRANEAGGFREIGTFLGRRFRRIWPPMAVMIFCIAAFCTLFSHVMLTKLRPDVLPSLFFFDNIAQILRGTSYFAQIGGPSPLTHLWYLGVSEQFCLLLALTFPFFRRIDTRQRAIVFLLLAAVSTILMAVLYVPGDDPTRVYYGTDTRAFAPLLGAALAIVFPLGYSTERQDGFASSARARTLMGVTSLALITLIMVLIPAESEILYRGGMALVATLAAVLVYALPPGDNPLCHVLASKPLTWLGSRSFSLYLWHYPIIALMGINASYSPWWLIGLALALSLVATEISYRLFERTKGGNNAMKDQDTQTRDAQKQARNAQSRRTQAQRRTSESSPRSHNTSRNDRDQKNSSPRSIPIPAIILGVVIFTAIIGLLVVPNTSLVPEDALVSTGESAGQARDLSAEGSGEQSNTSSEEPEVLDTAPPPVDLDAITSASASANLVAAGGYCPVIIGDSVPGDAEWMETFPNALLDNYIGRQPFQANNVLQGYLDQGVVGPVVVMAAYSNSTPSIENLEAAVEAVGSDRKIFLVGTVNSDGFQEEANANIMEVANADPNDNVFYIDWPSVCAGHEAEYLWADVTHLRPEGAVVYVNTILRAIAQAMVDTGGSVA